MQAWEYVQKALVIGKQLKDWTVQSNALRGAVVSLPMCCDPACYTRTQPFVNFPTAFCVSFYTVGYICNVWGMAKLSHLLLLEFVHKCAVIKPMKEESSSSQHCSCCPTGHFPITRALRAGS